MRVSRAKFESLNANDSIELELKEGFFKIQWVKK